MRDLSYREMNLERGDDGIVFYEGAFTPGVRVSASEAEVYLSGDEGAWSDIIYGRERTEPPRSYWPALNNRIVLLPPFVFIVAVVSGASLIARGVRAATGSVELLQIGGGIFVMVTGLYGLWLLRSRR